MTRSDRTAGTSLPPHPPHLKSRVHAEGLEEGQPAHVGTPLARTEHLAPSSQPGGLGPLHLGQVAQFLLRRGGLVAHGQRGAGRHSVEHGGVDLDLKTPASSRGLMALE